MAQAIPAPGETRDAPSGIPLDLAPLLAPYRRRGRLSLRIERLPSRARFSRGRNNDDRTWSLTPEDLEGLRYLPPDGVTEPHMLALRIVSLDGDAGTTLAVLDLPVARETGLPVAAPTADTPDDGELRRVREELAAVRAALAARDAEVASTHAAWEAERARLSDAAAEAAETLERNRAAWHAEREHHNAALEYRSQEHVQQARGQWEQELRAALAKAEAAWKAGEDARIAAAEAQWRSKTTRPISEAMARFEQTAAALAEAQAEVKRHDAELTKLRAALAIRETELAETRKSIERARADAAKQAIEAERTTARAAFEAELAQRLAQSEQRAQERLRQAREQWQQEAGSASAQAEADWKAGEAQRLAAAKAQWREQSARTLAEAYDETKRQGAELGRLRDDLAAARAALAGRESELAETQQQLAHARADESKQLIEAALAEARAAWETEVAQRLAIAEQGSQHRLDQAREQWQREAAAALATSERAWKASEAVRLAAAEIRWREQFAPAPMGASLQGEHLDAELQRLRAELAEAAAALAARDVELAEARQTGHLDAELQRLRAELAEAASAVAARDLELAEARRTIELVRAEASQPRQDVHPIAQSGISEVELENRLAQAEQRAEERLEQARARWQREAAAAQAKAQEAWKSGEVARFAAAEVQWRDRSAHELVEARARSERDEAALLEARSQFKRYDAELRGLRGELTEAKNGLAARDAELAQLRAAAGLPPPERRAETAQKARAEFDVNALQQAQDAVSERLNLRTGARAAKSPEVVEATITAKRRSRGIGRLVAGGAVFAVAAALVAVFIQVGPQILAGGSPRNVAPAAAPEPSQHQADLAAVPSAAEPVKTAKHRTIVSVSIANMRTSPSTTAAVITTLSRDTEVVPIERRGSWVFIRIGDGARKQEGWVFGSNLLDMTGP